MDSDLAFSGISKTYPGVKALTDVSFTVRAGSVHGLMGENGAGKSTLIKILSGDTRPDGGTIQLAGDGQSFDSPRDAFKAGITVVHQELQLVPGLTVGENLWLGRFPAKLGVIDYRRLFAEVDDKLRSLGIDIDARTLVADLSIGARQMIEIAKGAMSASRVVALDEPTSSLSSRESEILFALIRQMRLDGKIVLYISHRLDEIFLLCDGCTVLRDGRLAAHHATMDGVTRAGIIGEMVGREIQDIWGWRGRTMGEVRLQVDSLAGSRLPSPISFTAQRGEILGFFGLVGAGRSELMRLVYGADQRTQGSVSIDGGTVAPNRPACSIAAGLVLCSEDRKQDGIIQGQSITDNIMISSRRQHSPFGVVREAYEGARADEFIQNLKIRTPSRNQDIVNLSGGNQQKVLLSRWLSEPNLKVLIVDEPTRGIDVGAKSEIYELLYTLAEKGHAIVVVSSELPEIMGIADRLHVMCAGEISATFERRDFTEQAILDASLPDRSRHAPAAITVAAIGKTSA